jgi:hypothetical protein
MGVLRLPQCPYMSLHPVTMACFLTEDVPSLSCASLLGLGNNFSQKPWHLGEEGSLDVSSEPWVCSAMLGCHCLQAFSVVGAAEVLKLSAV